MFIYVITNSVNGKVYIGQTRGTIENRLREHFEAARANSLQRIHQAIRKHGQKAFTIALLETCETVEQLNEREAFWIAKYASRNYNFGYNMSPGGFGIADETKAKLSVALSGANNARYGKPGIKGNLGNKLTVEQRIRVSIGRKGKGTGPNPKHAQPGELNGFFGKKHSAVTRKCISESIRTGIAALTESERALRFTGSPRFGEDNPFFGRKHSAETRAKMSAYWAKRRAEKEAKHV